MPPANCSHPGPAVFFSRERPAFLTPARAAFFPPAPASHLPDPDSRKNKLLQNRAIVERVCDQLHAAAHSLGPVLGGFSPVVIAAKNLWTVTRLELSAIEDELADL